MNTKTDGISSGLRVLCYMSEQFEFALFSEPPTDPLYADMFPVVLLSDAEAIISAKDAEIERLKQTPTIEDAKTTVEHLRAYASDNGYSHGDYADVMTEAANQIEKQSERIKELESDADEEAHIRDRMAQLLAETAVALKGPEKALHRHGWQDLPEAAGKQSSALKLARQVLMSVKETSSSTRLRRIVNEPLAAINEVLGE